jgi:hypothetical protein
MKSRAHNKSLGKCAAYVRIGLEAGGANTTGHPLEAKNYGPTLEKNGFTPVSSENYYPQPGDTAVFQPHPGGNSAGHIETFDGSNWVSDFTQRRFIASSGYANSKYQIYRAPK